MPRHSHHALAVIALASGALTGCSPSRTEPLSDRVDQLFAKYNNPRSPGCSVAVSRAGKILYEHGYGMADLEWGQPITPTTVMGAASISKQFTAMSILVLVESGRLSLDDDVSKYIPEWQDHEHHVTIRHLLTHTSGLREGFNLLGMAGHNIYSDTNEAMVRMLARQHGVNAPAGAEFYYNNGAYNLLGSIVKRVSGQSLRDFEDANIFRPLGMTHSQLRDDPALLIADRAAGYTIDEHGVHAASEAVGITGNAGLYTTPHDLLLWERNFDEVRVGTPELLAAMQKSAVLADGKPANYGFGLFIENYRGLRSVEHSGGDRGISTNLARYPDRKFAIAVMCNSDTINPVELTHRITDIYLADALSPVPPAENAKAASSVLSAAEMSARSGLYMNTSDAGPTDLRVSVRDGKLIFHSFFGDDFDFHLNPTDARHATTVDGRVFEFVPSAGGQPAEWHVPGRPGVGGVFRLTMFTPRPAALQSFAGLYWSEELEAAYSVTPKDGDLMLQPPGQAAFSVQPLMEDTFGGSFGIVKFLRDARGAVTGFTADKYNSRRIRFDRMSRPRPPDRIEER